jgi:hypothetical protein
VFDVITKNATTIFLFPSSFVTVVGSEILVRGSGWIKSGPVMQIKHSGSEILNFYLMLRFFGRRSMENALLPATRNWQQLNRDRRELKIWKITIWEKSIHLST